MVVVPVVGGVERRWGARSVESVLAQTHEQWRLLLVVGEGEEEEARGIAEEVGSKVEGGARMERVEVVAARHRGGKVRSLLLLCLPAASDGR